MVIGGGGDDREFYLEFWGVSNVAVTGVLDLQVGGFSFSSASDARDGKM